MSGAKQGRGRPASVDRAAALDAAVRVFWRHGYDGASIALLTGEMGVSAPTLYAAFGSKEALYRDALERYRARQATDNAKAMAQSQTLYGKLSAFLRASAAGFATSEEGRGCMVSVGSLQSGPDAQNASKVTKAARCDTLTRFVAAIDAAKVAGELPEHVDSEGLARYFSAVIQGMAVQATDGASADQLNTLVDVALAAWPGPR